MSTLGWLLLVVVTAVVTALWVLGTPPVARGRVERFARRHCLTVTPANGNQIIAYLAITRRWRSAGLIAGLAVSIGLSLPDLRVQVSFLPLLAGWFAGALVAEARVTHREFGPRRGASLLPRDHARYLPRLHRLLIPVTAGLCLVTGVATLITSATGRTRPGPAALLLLTGLAVAAAVHLMQHRALRRPQPLAEPDVLAADDAIRSRSLHVLAAAGMVLVGYCTLAQLDLLLPEHLAWLTDPGYLGFPLLGWALASTVWPVAPSPDLPATRTAPNGDGT